MIDTLLAGMLCLVQPQISGDRPWTHQECRVRAHEFIEAGRAKHVDPFMLTAISIYECNLRDKAQLNDFEGKKLVAIDSCPMGVRFSGKGFIAKKKHATRQEMIARSASLLSEYKRFCDHDRCPFGPHHHYVGHYNWGYRVFSSGPAKNYPNDVKAIYDALVGHWSNIATGRARRLVTIIRRAHARLVQAKTAA